MQIAKALAGFCGAKADDLRKAIGKKNREAMAKLKPEFVEGCRASGTERATSSSWLWPTNEKSADYSFNKSPRRLLRADRLPHRVAEGQLPRRVHGGADLLGDGHEGQGPVLRRALRGDGDRDPAAGRQPLRPRVRRRRGQHPLRPRRRQGRRLPGGRGDQGARARRAARSRRCGTSASASTRRAVNKKAIEALIKCGAFGSTGATRKGMLAVLEQAQGAGQKAQQDAQIGQGSIFDLGRRRGGRGRRRGARSRPEPPADPARGVRAGASCWRSRRSRSACSSPRTRSRRCARRCASKVDCPLAELAERRDGDWVTVGGIITQAKKIRTRNGDHDDVRDARRPRGRGRDARLRQGARRVRGGARRRRRSCSCAAASTTRTRGKTCADRAERRAVRADATRRSSAAREAAARRAPQAPAAAAPAPRRARRLPATIDRRPQARARELPRRDRGRARDPTRAAAPRTLRSATATASRTTPTLRAELAELTRLATVSAVAGASASRPPRRAPQRARRACSALARAARSQSASSSAARALLVRRRASRARTAAPRSAARRGTRAQPSRAELALADVGVAVAVGAERRLASR